MIFIEPTNVYVQVFVLERQNITCKFFDKDGNVVNEHNVLASELTLSQSNNSYYYKFTNYTKSVELSTPTYVVSFNIDLADEVNSDADININQSVDISNMKVVNSNQLPASSVWGYVSRPLRADNTEFNDFTTYNSFQVLQPNGNSIFNFGRYYFTFKDDGTFGPVNNFLTATSVYTRDTKDPKNEGLFGVPVNRTSYQKIVTKVKPLPAYLDITKRFIKNNDYDSEYLVEF